MSGWKLNKNTKKAQDEASMFTAAMLNTMLKAVNPTKWNVGDGKPDKDTGEVNEFYIDRKSGDFYTREVSGWILQGSLKGQDGYNPVHVSSKQPGNPREGDLWINNGLFVLINGIWKEITGKSGAEGSKGREVVLRKSNDLLQWQYRNDPEWHTLYSLNQLIGPKGPKGDKGDKGDKGEDGREIELRKTKKYLQWRYVGDEWQNLIALDELKGTIEYHGGGGGVVIAGIIDVIAGTNITIDKTDPKRPIINSSGGGGGGDVASVFGRTGAVTAQSGDYTAAQVGLGNVDNTSDVDKPVSTLQAAADALKVAKAGDTMTGALDIALATGNSLIVDTNVLVVDATNNRVGVGTASPAQLFTVREPDPAKKTTFQIQQGTAGLDAQLRLADVNNVFKGDWLWKASDDTVRMSRTGSVQLVLTAANDIGVGTAVPASLLDVSKTTGGVLTLSRSDTSATANDTIGAVQFWNNDSQLTTQNIYAKIEVQAAQTVTTDAAAGNMLFYTTSTTAGSSPTERMRISNDGNVGIGITPTAVLHLKAGTAAANTAPLKFTAGTNLTAAVAGAMEYDGTNLYFSPSTTRQTVYLKPTAPSAYTVINGTTDRAYDADVTTIDELADVLATLIADLQTQGIIG